MAQNSFSYNGATITVDDVAGTVSIDRGSTIQTYGSTDIHQQLQAKRVDCHFSMMIVDPPSEYVDSKGKNQTYSIVEPEFTYLKSLNLSNTDTVRAVLNGLITRLAFFGGVGGNTNKEYGIKPYNPASGFGYALPIDIADVTITPVDETGEGLNDGSVSITLTGGEAGHQFQLYNTDASTIITPYQGSNTFNGLAPGIYRVQIQNTGDGGISAIIPFTINAYVS